MSRPSPAPHRGDFLAWMGFCGFLGRSRGNPTEPHAHHAILLALGGPAGLRVQVGREGEWHPCAAALVPSRAVHRVDATACAVSLLLFIEPDTPEGKALGHRLQGRLELLAPRTVAPALKRLDAAWRVERSRDAAQAACRQLVRDLSGVTPRLVSDTRVLGAVEAIALRVHEGVSLAELAAAAHLSPERFRHLFAQETGLALRTYVLWRRLLHVWTLLEAGESLAAAAPAAGFADVAHLSRTSRTMFGAPASLFPMARGQAAAAPAH